MLFESADGATFYPGGRWPAGHLRAAPADGRVSPLRGEAPEDDRVDGLSLARVADGARFTCRLERTGSWGRFRDAVLGTLPVARAGKTAVTIRPASATTWKAINLSFVDITRK